jgi:hypothetical protein
VQRARVHARAWLLTLEWGGQILRQFILVLAEFGWLTRHIFAVNTSAHENYDFAYCGGKAHGQDGVTIRRKHPCAEHKAPKEPFFMPKNKLKTPKN